jgi:protein-S-isoprenylcysteine O-methyltransferase Ste14
MMPDSQVAPTIRYLKPATLSVQDIAVEMLIRATSAFLVGIFAYNAFNNWLADPTRITLLLMVVAECLTIGISLIARVPCRRDWNPVALLSSLVATYYFLAIQLTPGIRIVPEAIGVGMQIAGIVWQIFAKISLRQSFGLLPANRGVVSHGAYRVVRHPIYLGYFIADLGFLLTNFGIQNLLVYAALFALFGIRIAREEAFLSEDPAYVEYQSKVRFRVFPRIF